jgi:hypothetical protein
MKKTLLLFFAFITVEAFSTTYFVSPTGKSANDGKSFATAKDLVSAIPLAKAGDSLLLQGGTYKIAYTTDVANTIKLTQSGTSGKPIFMVSYNNSKVIIDFQFPEHLWVQNSYGFNLTGSYWYFKGLTITNAGYQGVYNRGAYNTFNNCVFSYCRFSGLEINKGGSNTTVINCDSYRNYDPKNMGGSADGFAPKQTMGVGNVLIGCRAWENSDDGYDTFGDLNTPNVFVIMENCWAFNNGSIKIGTVTYTGNKDGFKLGGNNVPQQNQAYNCIAFGNPLRGFDENNNKGSVKVYNCLGYNNGANFTFTGTLNSGEQHDFRNNISLKETTASNIKSTNKQMNNTWNGISVSASDFKSVDVSLATIARNPDGSIPETDLFRLKTGGKLIDAGTTTGRAYLGKAPDLGPFEYSDITTDLFEEPNFQNNIVVFPTIVEQHVHVRLLASFNEASVVIYSMQGIIVYQGMLESNESVIQCPELKTGKYIVTVKNEGVTSSFYIIKK